MESSEKYTKLNNPDLIQVDRTKGDVFVITTQAAKNIIQEFIRSQMEFFSYEVSKEQRYILEKRIDEQMNKLNSSLTNLINDKFDKLSESIVEKIITRRFNEEVERMVNRKINDINKKK